MRFELVTKDRTLRPAVEALVTEVFQREYGAEVPSLPELMIAAVDAHNRPQCVAGLRDAASGFFSELYLDQPVECALAGTANAPVARSDILELCAVAAARPGGLLLLIRGFAEVGLARGYRWGLFTATRRLRAMAGRMGLDLLDLGPAVPERIADAARWGSYYEQDPRVCAIDGRPAQDRLDRVHMPCHPARVAEASQ